MVWMIIIVCVVIFLFGYLEGDNGDGWGIFFGVLIPTIIVMIFAVNDDNIILNRAQFLKKEIVILPNGESGRIDSISYYVEGKLISEKVLINIMSKEND